MTGPLITAPGGGVTNVGLGVGDNATGFHRVGHALVVSVSGDLAMQFLPGTREAMFAYGINAALQRISAVGDATMATDALNRRSGDGRYLQTATGGIVGGPLMLMTAPVVDNDAATKVYVDRRRAPSLLVDVPFDHPIEAGDWRTLADQPFAIPRGGDSLVMVSLSCNIRDNRAQKGIGYIGARIQGGAERIIWFYSVASSSGPPAPNPAMASGVAVNLYAEVSGANPIITIQLRSLNGGPPSPDGDFVVIGGDQSVAERSQFAIIDLGPR